MKRFFDDNAPIIIGILIVICAIAFVKAVRNERNAYSTTAEERFPQ